MLWILVISVALVTSIVDERSKQLDKEYEELLGVKLEGGEETEKNEETEENEVGFNPHEDLHNEEFKKWASGEPYMMKASRADKEGYVCQQFTLPTDGGTSLAMVGVQDLNACKCACNERRGEAKAQGKVGCNAFAYLPGQNVQAETNVTVNECHLKKHFMYHEDWVKVVNPWIFCVQQVGPAGAAVETQVASSAFDSNTVSVAATSAMFTALLAFGFFHFYYKSKTAKSYLLLDDEI